MNTPAAGSSSTLGSVGCEGPVPPTNKDDSVTMEEDQVTLDASIDESRTWEIATDGDLYIVVKNQKKDTLSYLVQAAVVENMSKPWAALVRDALCDGKATFEDEKATAETTGEAPTTTTNKELENDTMIPPADLPQIFLPHEHPETVLITLTTAHHRPWELPSAVSLKLLHALAMHCADFDTCGLVSEAIIPWVERLALQATRCGDLRWLYIGRVFWLDCIFHAQLQYWIWASTRDTISNPLFEIRRNGDEILDRDFRDCIAGSRKEILSSLLEKCIRLHDEKGFRKEWVCLGPSRAKQCSRHAHVSFLVSLQSLGLWPKTPSASELALSASKLRRHLLQIRLTPYSVEHSSCALSSFREDVFFMSASTNLENSSIQERFVGPQRHIFKARYAAYIGSSIWTSGITRSDFNYSLSVGSSVGVVPVGALDSLPILVALATDSEDGNMESDWESDSEMDSEPGEEFLEYDYDDLRECLGFCSKNSTPLASPDEDEVTESGDGEDFDSDAMSM
ncbi:hypothetical protein K458DRAFT_412246 [Lentithecium fluviatile CBS 122367]|uniref:Uncharacterized protein n=1 Tax=Lentithecium fluviatile CBS 122367 TaxID=1168545 RepID=A0A6G1JKG3_9PLEO|nr:hypothetical protein K458DRAFT_412246 [Lentithecium fluviatile CBS 122367]